VKDVETITKLLGVVEGVIEMSEANGWPMDEGEIDSIVDQLRVWLADGKRIVLYRNEGLDHSGLGTISGMTFGDERCQIESAEPPRTMPDGLTNPIGGQINWAWQAYAEVVDR